jgi:hypothetical protein
MKPESFRGPNLDGPRNPKDKDFLDGTLVILLQLLGQAFTVVFPIEGCYVME